MRKFLEPPSNAIDYLAQNLEQWSKPTVAQMREALLSGHFFGGATHLNDANSVATERILATLEIGFVGTVREGQLFDLGYLSNEDIKSEGPRAAALFRAGHIGHPFRTPYAIFHTWEGGGSLYLVDPDINKGSDHNENQFLIAEALTMLAFKKERVLMATCAAFVEPAPDQYHGFPIYGIPVPGFIANLAEPVFASLLMLATDGVGVDRIEADEKLNKARVKSGKDAIPGHWQVHTEQYVTAIGRGKRTRSEDQGGHHASPRPHLRRGHIRHKSDYHGGGEVWVRDALVMLKDGSEMPTLGRSFYQHAQARR